MLRALRGRLRQRHRRFAARPTRVIVPDVTFTATAEVVALVDGTPVFVYAADSARGWAARGEGQGAEAARPDRS